GSRIKTLLENRWKKLYQPVMLVAHLWIHDTMEKNFSKYLDLAWNAVDEVDPIAWWEGNFKESASELCKVASRILNIPSSSAAAKRNWSNFSYIYDKKRSRLTLPRILKLVYIYSNYKLTRPKSESKDLMEAVLRFNSRPSDEINKFELLDPDSDEYEELVESNSENETVELSESEIESATESDIDDESE
ncbi:26163_t:CDS:2, partial [Gigaspora rosea]